MFHRFFLPSIRILPFNQFFNRKISWMHVARSEQKTTIRIFSNFSIKFYLKSANNKVSACFCLWIAYFCHSLPLLKCSYLIFSSLKYFFLRPYYLFSLHIKSYKYVKRKLLRFVLRRVIFWQCADYNHHTAANTLNNFLLFIIENCCFLIFFFSVFAFQVNFHHWHAKHSHRIYIDVYHCFFCIEFCFHIFKVQTSVNLYISMHIYEPYYLSFQWNKWTNEWAKCIWLSSFTQHIKITMHVSIL